MISIVRPKISTVCWWYLISEKFTCRRKPWTKCHWDEISHFVPKSFHMRACHEKWWRLRLGTLFQRYQVGDSSSFSSTVEKPKSRVLLLSDNENKEVVIHTTIGMKLCSHSHVRFFSDLLTPSLHFASPHWFYIFWVLILYCYWV